MPAMKLLKSIRVLDPLFFKLNDVDLNEQTRKIVSRGDSLWDLKRSLESVCYRSNRMISLGKKLLSLSKIDELITF